MGGLRPAVPGSRPVGVGPAPTRAAGVRLWVAGPPHPRNPAEIDAGLILKPPHGRGPSGPTNPAMASISFVPSARRAAGV